MYAQSPSLPPPPGAPRANAEPIRPSAGWFGLAGLVAGIGIVVAIVLWVRTVTGYLDKIDDFQRIDIPGEGTVTLEETGGYTIYHEYPGADDDFFGPDIASITVTAPDGSGVDLRDYSSTVTYSGSGHDGIALFSFTADEAGAYAVSVDGDGGELAVGRGLGGGIVGGIVGGLVVGFVGVVAGIVIAVVVGVQRGRNRRRRQVWGRPPPGPPGFGAPAGAPQPGSGSYWGPPPGPQGPQGPPAPPAPASGPWPPPPRS